MSARDEGRGGLIALSLDDCDWLIAALYEHCTNDDCRALYERLVTWRERHVEVPVGYPETPPDDNAVRDAG